MGRRTIKMIHLMFKFLEEARESTETWDHMSNRMKRKRK